MTAVLRPDRVVQAFAAIVAISVGLALAGLTWRLAGVSATPAASIAVAPPAAVPPTDITPITSLAPFGRAAPVVASTSALGLQLRAILLAQPRSASSVLIGVPGGPARAFRIGDAAPGGAIIDSIAIDHIVLRIGDRLEMMAFPKPGAASAGTLPAGPLPGPFPDVTTVVPAMMPGQAPLIAPPPPSARIATGPTAPGNARGFLDSIGATAVAGGYRIGANASPTMRAAGLQPGDVVEKVNGTLVGDADRDRPLFDAAASGAALNVELVRGGRRIALSLPAR